MQSNKCALNCGREYASKCERDAKRCGSCCDCAGHSRRSKRKGPASGGRSVQARAARTTESAELHALNDICEWLRTTQDVDWIHRGATTASARRRQVVREILLARRPQHLQEFPAGAPGALLELVPAPFVERLTAFMALRLDTPAYAEAATAAPEATSSIQVPPPPPRLPSPKWIMRGSAASSSGGPRPSGAVVNPESHRPRSHVLPAPPLPPATPALPGSMTSSAEDPRSQVDEHSESSETDADQQDPQDCLLYTSPSPRD